MSHRRVVGALITLKPAGSLGVLQTPPLNRCQPQTAPQFNAGTSAADCADLVSHNADYQTQNVSESFLNQQLTEAKSVWPQRT